MSNLQAAVGVAQMERLAETLEKKRQIGAWYDELLADIDALERSPARTDYAENIYWVYGVVLEGFVPFDAEEAMKRMQAKGIGTRPFFWPMHEQPVFRKDGPLLRRLLPGGRAHRASRILYSERRGSDPRSSRASGGGASRNPGMTLSARRSTRRLVLVGQLVEQIMHNGEMLALIVRDEYSKPGISFFTPDDLSQQLAYMQHPAGKVIDAAFSQSGSAHGRLYAGNALHQARSSARGLLR